MSDRYDVEYLEEGDSYEGGPIEQSYFISAILAAGGQVEIHGDKVLITKLPKKEPSKEKTSQVKAPVSLKIEEPKAEEPKIKEVPEPEIVEAVEVVEETHPQISQEESKKTEIFKPKSFKPAAKPGPKPKAAPAAKPSSEKE